jgi:hypothetical protein
MAYQLYFLERISQLQKERPNFPKRLFANKIAKEFAVLTPDELKKYVKKSEIVIKSKNFLPFNKYEKIEDVSYPDPPLTNKDFIKYVKAISLSHRIKIFIIESDDISFLTLSEAIAYKKRHLGVSNIKTIEFFKGCEILDSKNDYK